MIHLVAQIKEMMMKMMKMMVLRMNKEVSIVERSWIFMYSILRIVGRIEKGKWSGFE